MKFRSTNNKLRKLRIVLLVTVLAFSLILPTFAQEAEPDAPTGQAQAKALYLPLVTATGQRVDTVTEQDFTDADFADGEEAVEIASADSSSRGALFVASNSFDALRGNEVIMYRRAADGLLTLIGHFPTGGQGSGPGTRFRGDGLGADGSVTLSKNHRWLFVTNAGSNQVSVFRVYRHGLELRSVVDSGGLFPNSVTVRKNAVYVLNSGNDGNITGFKMDGQGHLTPLADSTRDLNGNQSYPPDALYNHAGVEFSPDGDHLVITIKDGPPIPEATGPGRILVFTVDNRLPSAAPVIDEGTNNGPFGFTFDRKGRLLVSHFVGGVGLTGAASSYEIEDDGSLEEISLNVSDGQIDTCWLVTNDDYVYGSNFGSDTISSWTLDDDGELELLDATAATTVGVGTFPIDLGITPNGEYLYLVQPGNGKVGMWAINDDGSLTSLGEADGLEPTAATEPTEYFTHMGGSPAGIAVY